MYLIFIRYISKYSFIVTFITKIRKFCLLNVKNSVYSRYQGFLRVCSTSFRRTFYCSHCPLFVTFIYMCLFNQYIHLKIIFSNFITTYNYVYINKYYDISYDDVTDFLKILNELVELLLRSYKQLSKYVTKQLC